MISVAPANLELFLTSWGFYSLVIGAATVSTWKRDTFHNLSNRQILHCVIAVQQRTVDRSWFITILCCSEILGEDLELMFLSVHWDVTWSAKASWRIKKILCFFVFKIIVGESFIWMEDTDRVGQRLDSWFLNACCCCLLPLQPRCPSDASKRECFAFFAKRIAAYSSVRHSFACEWSSVIKQIIWYSLCLEESLWKDLLTCQVRLMSELELFVEYVCVLAEN